MGYFGNKFLMHGGYCGGDYLHFIVWLLVIVDLALLGIWLWKKISEK